MINDLNYEFTCTASPVQAEGNINGNEFYFRSRHEHWTFAISEDPHVNPVDIQSVEKGLKYGFFIEKQYGKKRFDASYMQLDEAKKIIESCVEIYLKDKAAKI